MKKLLLLFFVGLSVFSAQAMNEMSALLRSNSGSLSKVHSSKSSFNQKQDQLKTQAGSEQKANQVGLKTRRKLRKMSKRRECLSESTESTPSYENNREKLYTYDQNVTLPEDIDIVDAEEFLKMSKETAIRVQLSQHLLCYLNSSSFDSLDGAADKLVRRGIAKDKEKVTLPDDIEIMDFERLQKLQDAMIRRNLMNNAAEIRLDLDDISSDLIELKKRVLSLQ